MSSANVLPSAPVFGESETQSLYPLLPIQHDNFRLTKINEICLTLDRELTHYRLVSKKYSKTKTAVNWTSAGFGFLSAVLSSASLGSALSGVGIIISIPLGAIAGLFSLTSTALIGGSKKIEIKLSKHREIVTLAIAKRETVNRLVSKALVDQKINDAEFQIILDEMTQYNALKEAVRLRLTRKPSLQNVKDLSPKPDLEKIRQEIRHEEKQKLKKRLSAVSSSDLKE